MEAATQLEKVALITGITGQDGSYLTDLLLSKGYQVHGIIRTQGSKRANRLFNSPFINTQGASLKVHHGDMKDRPRLMSIVAEVRPTEIYNLAAQSHVMVPFELSEYTADVDAMGTLRLLDAIRTAGIADTTKFYQASTSELFGKVKEVPQKETTPFHPRSPYGVAKLYSYWICRNYREMYGMFACNGILFNHESPRRGESFVTRKITRAVASIHLGRQQFFELGNIDAERDWGHAKDYVEAMWLMLQREEAEDFIISTGQTHKVRTFVVIAFQHINVDIVWEGSGLEEVGKDKATGIVRVTINSKFYRPIEESLIGDCTKAKTELKWEPKISFERLVKEMVEADIEGLKDDPKS